jgi:hypothetical protein
VTKPRFSPEAKTKHYMVVHPKVVRDTGSANDALVLIRMTWRCEELTSYTWQDQGGRIWWIVSAGVIADETGLKKNQVYHSLKRLREAGWIEELDRGQGQEKGYAPAEKIASEPSDGSDTPLSDDSDAPSNGSEGGVSDDSDALLSIELEAYGDDYTNTSAALFDRVWLAWPSARRGARKKAVESWAAIVRAYGLAQVSAVVVPIGEQFGARYSTWVAADLKYVPHVVTWLNQERWTTPLPEVSRGQRPTTVEHGRSVDQILRDREAAAVDERKAVSA